MIVTTTHDVQGRRIQEYHGLVTGEAILGANVFRDFFASIRDVVAAPAPMSAFLRTHETVRSRTWSRRPARVVRTP